MMFGYYLDLAFVRCRQNPWMVALLVLTMAIGIASYMTAMTIFGALSGEPLPGISNHLYVVTMDARQAVDKDNPGYDKPDSLLGFRDARTLVDAHQARAQMALTMSVARLSRADGRVSDRAFGLMGHGPLLQMLGVPLRFGRPWTLAEQRRHDPVVVVDAGVAQKLFGTENAVGKSLKLGHRLFRVVGVTASWKPRMWFFGLAQESAGLLGQDVQFFVPVGSALDAGVPPFNAGQCGKDAPLISIQSTKLEHCRWLETWVALDSPAEVAGFRRFLAGYAQSRHAAGHFVYPPHAKLYGTQAWMGLNHVVPKDVGLNLMLAAGFLLLCMVNVAGLLAARFLRRRSAVAIRRALGASRRQVFLQHVIEAGLLGLAGGLLALPLTLLGLWIVRMQPVAYAAAAQFSIVVFIGLVLLSMLVGLVVGILPAWRVCRQPPALQIKVA